MRTFDVDAAPVHRRGRQQRCLAEQLLREVRQKPKQPRAFQHSAAERVDHRHRAAAQHLDQADHPQLGVRAQVERVGVVGVDPAQHHVHPFEGAHGPHPQLAVAHHQIGALDQRKTQHAGQVGLVERRLGVDTGAEHDHHRLLGRFGGGVDERQPQRLRPRRGGTRADLLVDVRDGVCDNAPVGERIAGTRGRLRPVGVDQELTRRRPADVASVQEQLVATRCRDAAGRPDVAGVGEQQLRRQHAAGDRAPQAVEVGQHGVQQPRALHQAGFQRVPVRGGDHQWQRVELPGPRHPGAVAVGDRIAVVIDLDVGDAVVVDEAAHHRPKAVEAVAATVAHTVGQLLPGRPDIPCRVDEFVVAGSRAGTVGWTSKSTCWARMVR